MSVPTDRTAAVDPDVLVLRWAAMRPRVIGTLRQRGLVAADAEDVYSQALVRAIERADRLHNPDAAEGWFYTLAHRLALDHTRQRGRELARRSTEDPDQMETVVEEPAAPCSCSLRMLDDLPDGLSELVRTVDIDGSRVADAARTLGITPNSASVRLFRARRALRQRLFDVCGTTRASECADCGCAPDASTSCHGK
jgi:RNA polymerase sigma factor (sigma-70 family)